jgi:hypothetical protein
MQEQESRIDNQSLTLGGDFPLPDAPVSVATGPEAGHPGDTIALDRSEVVPPTLPNVEHVTSDGTTITPPEMPTVLEADVSNEVLGQPGLCFSHQGSSWKISPAKQPCHVSA